MAKTPVAVCEDWGGSLELANYIRDYHLMTLTDDTSCNINITVSNQGNRNKTDTQVTLQ
jgi:hypothetical protein